VYVDPESAREQVDCDFQLWDSTVEGVVAPADMNSSKFPLKEVLARIMIVGVSAEPITAVLLRNPSSIPPKQDGLEHMRPPFAHCIKKRRPVELYLNATVMPAVDTVIIWVSVHSPGSTIPSIFTGVCDETAVIVVGDSALAC